MRKLTTSMNTECVNRGLGVGTAKRKEAGNIDDLEYEPWNGQ